MKDLFDEKQVSEFSDKILRDLTVKIKKDIADSFYTEYKDYLYEHYEMIKDKIQMNLIKEITEQFVLNPKEYRYKDLRRKIWNENKEELTKTLTDEAIQESIENIILASTHTSSHFNFLWLDGITKIILKNWDKFKDDERIKNAFGRELDQRQNRIDYLEKLIAEGNGDV